MTSVTRQHLYEEIWAEPMTTVAKRYGVSSNYLARICERLKIPRPPRGYWQQKSAGQKVEHEPLPPPDPGDEMAWHRGRSDYSRSAAPLPVFTGIGPRKTRREERPKTHPLLVGVRDDFLDSRERKYEHDGYLKPKNQALPDIFVSKDALATALDIANRLYLALEDEGHWVRAAADFHYSRPTVEHREGTGHRETERLWSPGRPTLVFIGGVAIGLALFELAENVEVVLQDSEWVRAPKTRATEHTRQVASWRFSTHFLPSGRLGLVAYSPYQRGSWLRRWEEAKAGEFKKLIKDIVGELEAAAPQIATLTTEAERKAREEHQAFLQRERERHQKELAELRAKAVKDSRANLLTVIDGWVTACNIERFFEGLAKVSAMADDKRTTTEQRIERARALFGGVDALEHFRAWKTPEQFYAEAKKGLWWNPDDFE